MGRKGTWQIGRFDVQPGMVFTMPEMDKLYPNGQDMYAGEHPWLVLNVYEDYIETVMCTTLISQTKHRADRLDNYDRIDIVNSCPPMDRPNKLTSSYSANTIIIIPKRELFSHKLKLSNENTSERNFTTEGLKSLCIDKKTMNYINDDIRNLCNNNVIKWSDPFECEEHEEYLYDLEEGLPVPNGFTKESYEEKFGWRHLRKADPDAVYPFEDQMHDYEKADPELLRIARRKKAKTRKPEDDRPVRRKNNEPTRREQSTGTALSDEQMIALAEKARPKKEQSKQRKPKKTKMSHEELEEKTKELGNSVKTQDSQNGLTYPR